MTSDPVFVHSLFRAGSTYVFSRLRSCPELFCYYEPMHELVAWAADDVTRLQIESRPAKMQQLRHPAMSQPYFDELKSVWPAWQQSLPPEVVYGGYFAESPKTAGKPFYDALRSAAPRRPVFSECRTAGRMPILKESVGGHHAYLWRNPWDQWWSYQIDPYFDAATRVIAHANPLPEPLRELKGEFDVAAAPVSSFTEARDFYDLRPLDFEASYAWFYGLWLNLLDLASTTADLMISIDSLGRDSGYTDEVSKTFVAWGVPNPDFSDACSPVAGYTAEEATAFTAVEARVHELFMRAGWDQARVAAVRYLRDQHRVGEPADSDSEASGIQRRNALLSARNHDVARAQKWGALHKEQADSLKAATHDIGALHRALDHDRAVLAEQKLEIDRLRLTERQFSLAQKHIEQLHASLSWRLTAPLRYVADFALAAPGAKPRVTMGKPSLLYYAAGLIGRVPLLGSGVRIALAKVPGLERLLLTWVARFEGAAHKPTDEDPEALSLRATEIYQELAREVDASSGLKSPELDGPGGKE